MSWLRSRPKITRIQIKGERCSGTNFLESLIRENLIDARVVTDYGWKHFFQRREIDEGAADCLFVIIYRSPFDWLRSLHRNPFHAAPELRSLDFSEFIRSQWYCVWNEESGTPEGHRLYGQEMMFERDPETGARFDNVIRLRTAKIRNFEAIRERARYTRYVRYEDLAADPKSFIRSLARDFQLKRRYRFAAIKTERGAGNAPFQPKKYQGISAADQQFILANLCLPLEREIGYLRDQEP